MNKKSILVFLVFCVVSCNSPDDDSSAGNGEAQNPPPGASAGNNEAQNPAPSEFGGDGEENNPPSANSEAQNPPMDVLQYYLGLKKLSKDQMYPGEDGALVNKEKRQITDASGETVSLVHSIELVTSGVNRNRQAFLVQESYKEPDASVPEHDRYMCSLLVFISREGAWRLENNDMFNESDDNGVTRRKEPCDGFKLAWENEFPVLLSAAGKVHLQNGKYVLEVAESDEPH
jgi:hypothetical protein